MPTTPALYATLMARLKWLMVFRVALVIIFLGTSIWLQFKEVLAFQSVLYPIYTIIVITCLLTILYANLFRWVKNAELFAYFQIFVDILLITATVYVTGGMESILSFLYFLSIISTSILLNRRGGFYAASASSIAYGVLVNLDFYKILPAGYKLIIPSGIGYDRGDILATVVLNIIGFFTVAFLTGYLAERTIKVEKELEEQKIDFKKLEAINKYIVENINSGILTINSSERITSFNRAAEKVMGYKLDEIYNKPIDTVFPDLMKAKHYSIIPEETSASYFRIEKTFKRKDGKELFLGFAASPMKEGGYIIIFQDLTRIKEIEEQLRRVDRLRALGELAAGMAHEVRNPLTSISGSVQVLKKSLMLDGESQHLMNTVIREAERLNALITDFLLFAKPATKMTKIDLRDIINETVNIFKNSPESGNIDIQLKAEDGLIVEGDSRQLKQVFWNLFINAGNAMLDGGVLRIDSRLKTQDHSLGSGVLGLKSDSVEVTVSDTGMGIPPENIERIFDPFFTTKDSGTGLGLAVVHRIIEGHNGKIEVKSKKGEGTRFRILLPSLLS